MAEKVNMPSQKKEKKKKRKKKLPRIFMIIPAGLHYFAGQLRTDYAVQRERLRGGQYIQGK